MVPGRLRLPVRVFWLRATGELEPELRHLDSILIRRRTALDIGANHGIYCHALARTFDQVHAFEPQPACVATLEGWNAPNVTVHQIGLSDRPRTLDLHIPVVGQVPLTGYASVGPIDGPSQTLRMDVRRIDDLELTDIDFIKIDVEGHELEVVRGGRETIATHRPVLLIEIEQRHLGPDRDVRAIIAEIADLGYSCLVLRNQQWVDGNGFDADVDQRIIGGEPVQPYTNLFAFVPTDSQ